MITEAKHGLSHVNTALCGLHCEAGGFIRVSYTTLGFLIFLFLVLHLYEAENLTLLYLLLFI